MHILHSQMVNVTKTSLRRRITQLKPSPQQSMTGKPWSWEWLHPKDFKQIRAPGVDENSRSSNLVNLVFTAPPPAGCPGSVSASPH